MTWTRARTADQISQRERAILHAAGRLVKSEGYENSSLNKIAAEAGFTKSNVYRYFSSREEIFLVIYTDLVTAWTRDMIDAYDTLPEDAETEEFAELWVETILKHKQLLELSPVLFISLERNSSAEQLESFKRTVGEMMTEHSKGLMRIFPFLNLQDVRRFLTFSHAIMASLWPSSNPDTALAKVYQKTEFQSFKPDFVEDMTSGIIALINGIKTKTMI
jgi:AcrR family transcriptional regulator